MDKKLKIVELQDVNNYLINFGDDVSSIFDDIFSFLLITTSNYGGNKHLVLDVFIVTKKFNIDKYEQFKSCFKLFEDKLFSQIDCSLNMHLMSLNILNERLKYVDSKEPSNTTTNKRCYQGLNWINCLLKRHIFFSGNLVKFEKFKLFANDIFGKWKNKLASTYLDLNSFNLLEAVVYQAPDDFKNKIEVLLKNIKLNKNELVNILTDCVSHEEAFDEVDEVIHLFENIDLQLSDLDLIRGKIGDVSVFLPINFPFYGFVLYAVVIGLVSENVFVRCPLLVRNVLHKCLYIIGFNSIFPHIQLLDLDRDSFKKKYVSKSEIIIFTGKYENANLLQSLFPKALFIYNGAGINPIIVSNDADLDLAVRKTIDMRVYNSGQDCAAPDAIFVQKLVYNKFIDKLSSALDKIEVGDYKIPSVRVGKSMSINNLIKNIEFLKDRKIIYGGLFDFGRGIMYPTIIESTFLENNYFEFFSPIFNVIYYNEDQDLKKFFNNEQYKQYSMYLSCFGSSEVAVNAHSEDTLLKNNIVLDIDEGYNDFGGYGKKANFIYFKGKKYYKPILIPRDVAQCLNDDQFIISN